MTVITISTVGYGEVHEMTSIGRLFTVALMLTSIGVFAYGLTTLATLVVEVQFGSMLWRRRMDKKIKALTGHNIICGYGRTGRAVCSQLSRGRKPFIVIEANPEKIERLRGMI